MSKTFFTADTHFGHARIIELCNRPFESVEDMDEEMIARWNKIVGPDDTVWHLGDFSLRGPEVVESYRRQLNGHIALVWGNHDRLGVQKMNTWVQSQSMAEIHLLGWNITMCHYAMRVWHGSHFKESRHLMLYGHSHGMLSPIHHSLDVGVDCWDFYPMTLGQIIDRLRIIVT